MGQQQQQPLFRAVTNQVYIRCTSKTLTAPHAILKHLEYYQQGVHVLKMIFHNMNYIEDCPSAQVK